METIKSALQAYKEGRKPSDYVKGYLEKIQTTNPKLNAYLQVREEATLESAKQLDGKKNDLPLYGIPLAIKDNILVKGWQCTAGSKILDGYVSPYTATVVERLEAAGAVVVGKTNLDEFAMGSSTENSAYGVVRNPWNLDKVPGGSSGGSAAAVSAQTALASLGSETGGSIRQPASFCGLVGLKPTYGRVSRYGAVAFGSSLDQIGPFAHSAWDCARVMEVMAGHCRHDSTTSQSKVPRYTAEIEEKKTFKVGICREWVESEGLDPQVKKNFDESLEKLKASGCEIVDVELPHAKYSISCYYLIAPSEASSNLARYDGIHYGHRSKDAQTLEETYSFSRGEGIGAETKLRIMLGTYALSAGYYDAFYNKANQVRNLIKADFLNAFKNCDVIASPTAPSTAFGVGEKTDDPISMYLSDVFTSPANLAGVPAISLPSGLDDSGLPIGLQFFGRHFDETTLFQIGHRFESERGEFPLATGV